RDGVGEGWKPEPLIALPRTDQSKGGDREENEGRKPSTPGRQCVGAPGRAFEPSRGLRVFRSAVRASADRFRSRAPCEITGEDHGSESDARQSWRNIPAAACRAAE